MVEAEARELLASLPDESVDLVVTDPPYHFERGTSYFRDWFPELADRESPSLVAELFRVLRWDRHCYLFCDRRTLPLFDAATEMAGFRVHPPLVWDKDWLGLGGGAWRSQYEFVGWYEKGSRAGSSRRGANVLRARRPHRGYPTEKPVAVLRTLVEQASKPGELVLDPFCGSGSTGQAARELRRRALLCDVDTTSAARRLRLAPAALETART